MKEVSLSTTPMTPQIEVKWDPNEFKVQVFSDQKKIMLNGSTIQLEEVLEILTKRYNKDGLFVSSIEPEFVNGILFITIKRSDDQALVWDEPDKFLSYLKS